MMRAGAREEGCLAKNSKHPKQRTTYNKKMRTPAVTTAKRMRLQLQKQQSVARNSSTAEYERSQ